MKSDDKLLKLLVGSAVIDQTVLHMVANYMQRWKVSSCRAVLECSVMSESDLADALAQGMGIDRIFHCSTLPIENEVLRLLPFAVARRLEVLPVAIDDAGKQVEVVMSDPTNELILQEISEIVPQQLRLAVAERSDIVKAIDELYPLRDQVPELFAAPSADC